MSARSRFMAFMPAAPRSTTTKQFDCCTSKRSRLAVGGRRYSPVSTVYQPALTFSISETVPSGDSQRSSWLLSPAVAEPAALPVATVLADGLPICMSRAGMFWQPARAMSAAAVVAMADLESASRRGLPVDFFMRSSPFVAKGRDQAPRKFRGKERLAPVSKVTLLHGRQFP